MKPILKIFVAETCPGCVEALDTAARIKHDFPNIVVQVVDMDNPTTTIPEEVFATPTYMLNNRVVSLGNPGPDDIAQWAQEITMITQVQG